MRGTVQGMLYIARSPRPTGSGRNAILSHARGIGLHLPCQALRDSDGRVAAGPDQAASRHWRAVQSPKP